MSSELKTQADVMTLAKPSGGKTERVYFDSGKGKAKGLALRVRQDGSRVFTFYYRFGGAQKRIRIGDASNDPAGWTLAKARTKASEHRVNVDNGKDPQAEKEATDAKARQAANARSVGDVVETYLKARQTDMKPKSFIQCAQHLRVHLKPLHWLPVRSVERAAISDCLDKVEEQSGPIARNRARGALSAMFGWAIGKGWCESNPVEGTNKAPEKSRDRILTDAELAAIWKAAGVDTDYGRIVRLLMLTAQRRDEIGGLRWSEVNEEAKQIELPAERTKNSRAHDVPLSDSALALIKMGPPRKGNDTVLGEGAGGFSAWSRSKTRLDAKLGNAVKPWTLHDLRRTAATGMANIGIQPHVIEAVLNHVSGHKAGVAGIYNRSTYAAEKRAALDTWANHVKTIVAKSEGANVTRLKRA